MNLPARLCVVTVAGHENEQRYEPVEAVATLEDLHFRALAKAQNAQRSLEQLLLVHLKQFVARKGIEDMRQRLAVVAIAREAGTLQHMFHFQAQERIIRWPSAIRS